MPAHGHRRRSDLSAGGNRFSFSGPDSDQLEYETWAERIKTDGRNSFSRRDGDRKFGPWARRIHRPVAGDAFRWPESSAGRQLGAEMIARYRREMMDLVRSLPEEAAYELSLKDIIELPAPAPAPVPAKLEKGRTEDQLALTEKEKHKKRGKSAARSASVDAVRSLLNRLVLRTPAVRSSRKRTSGGGGGGGAKVTPKPVAEGSEDGSKSERSSSDGSSSSSRGGGIRTSGKASSCYSFWKKGRSRFREI